MKSKKNAVSFLGFTLIMFIILGVIMVFSAPVLKNRILDENSKQVEGDVEIEQSRSRNRNENRDESIGNSREIYELKNEILEEVDYRIKQASESQDEEVSDRYVCSIEGYVDDSGRPISINSDSRNDIQRLKNSGKKRFVFICEYR
ncbi:MAG: hypothetical protein R3Y28_05100 [Candidatus Gastranaerophilales bacterium]